MMARKRSKKVEDETEEQVKPATVHTTMGFKDPKFNVHVTEIQQEVRQEVQSYQYVKVSNQRSTNFTFSLGTMAVYLVPPKGNISFRTVELTKDQLAMLENFPSGVRVIHYN